MLSMGTRKDSYMTTFHISEPLGNELKGICSPKGRTRWILSAIAALACFDESERNDMLKADLRRRYEPMTALPVRVPKETQDKLREILIAFRRECPEWDIDNSGIVRTAIVFYLRYHEGRFV